MIDAQARAAQAREYFYAGYNCAQSVVATFHDIIGIDEKTALKLASSFGGGVGRMREICGAVSGMAIIAGLLYGYDEPADDAAKSAHYAMVQALAGRFRETHGSIVCRDLLQTDDTSPVPEARTDQYYADRPCAALVVDAVVMLSGLINQKT